MINKTNKVIITLVIILIVLLVAAIVLAVVVVSNNKNNEKPESIAQDNSKIIEIQQIEDKDENEVLVAFLDGEQNNQNSGVVVIGGDTNYNEEINNVVKNNSSPYYIKINVQANVVTIYKKDGNGNYNIPLKSMTCSCGASTPLEGTYSLKKYNNWTWKTIDGGYGQYATQITGDILFSSVPYKIKGDKSSLYYLEYDKLGTIASTGSIRLTVRDAKWIYENCEAGTQVTFYISDIASPINFTSSQLITEDTQVRGWDPTDPDENNPWKTYVRPEKKQEEENKEENTNNVTNTTVDNTQNNNVNTTTSNSQENNVQEDNNVVTNNTLTESNTLENNNITNTIDSNTIENNIANNQINNNKVVENRLLERNNEVTITSEVIDTNNVQ